MRLFAFLALIVFMSSSYAAEPDAETYINAVEKLNDAEFAKFVSEARKDGTLENWTGLAMLVHNPQTLIRRAMVDVINSRS